jgi:hypothetical protein
MYSSAQEEDLGKPNNGQYHHFRAQPSPSQTPSPLTPMPAPKTARNGVAAGYLWKDGNNGLWNDAQSDHISNNGNDFGSITANWMEESSAEATCAAVGVGITVSEGSSPIEREDQGVVAYGWNNAPFNFAGRAGGWVDSCV